jgi:hypothetical protein
MKDEIEMQEKSQSEPLIKLERDSDVKTPLQRKPQPKNDSIVKNPVRIYSKGHAIVT